MDSDCRKVLSEINKPVTKIDNDTWSGIGFQIASDKFLIESAYIQEVIDANIQKHLSSMPGAKPWLLGLISFRGQPTPVIDLKYFLSNEKSKINASSRLIVIKNGNYVSGLLLEEIYGLKQFSLNADAETQESIKLFSEKSQEYIENTFSNNNELFGIFSIPRLINNKEFANAAR